MAKVASGRLTLRIPPKTHAELIEVANALGIDLTALLNLMISDVKPTYLEKAAAANRAYREALDELKKEMAERYQTMADFEGRPQENPVVQQLVREMRETVNADAHNYEHYEWEELLRERVKRQIPTAMAGPISWDRIVEAARKLFHEGYVPPPIPHTTEGFHAPPALPGVPKPATKRGKKS